MNIYIYIYIYLTYSQSDMSDVYTSSGYERVPLHFVGRVFHVEDIPHKDASMQVSAFDYGTDGGRQDVREAYETFAARCV